ncbi:S9 family peptidase [Phenylobacterium immobile]|uniref:S9 family peptidase n=1 Tax=Phenylobacterium immobile TaxID=21 RepID=UPI000B227D1B|nr:prolyl oligopeptidase family serine peptidase [Phenylobacterium immobile]
MASTSDPTPTVSPYGAWASPISAESLAKSAIGVSDLRAADGRLYWLENRPDEGGRLVVMTGDAGSDTGGDAGDARALTPEGFNVRTRVHEYGGASYLVVGDTLYFSNFADQRLHAQALSDRDAAPVPLTPAGYRYADYVAAPTLAFGGGLIGVREDHTDPADVRNAIVALSGAAGDAGRVLFGDSDFVAYPRVSRDGARLAWMAWDHPNMPWDDTRLYVADLGADGLANVRLVAGGGAEAVMEPQWGLDGALYFISDRTGFWNLYVLRSETAEPVLPMDAEFARPLWGLGQSNYVVLDDGRIACVYGAAHGDQLAVIDPAAGSVREIALPFTVIGAIHLLDAQTLALTGASGVETSAVATVELETGQATVVRRPSPAQLAPRHVSVAQAITFPGPDGREVHALYYPPANADFTAPEGEAPPLIVQVHGGPTGKASAAFSLANQYWTNRGFAVVDVDYGGSSGYGRAYRQRLNGQWGVVDVEDVIAAVRHLTAQGLADPDRVAIHGGSAGGFTVLAALSQSDVFSAGASFYGIADLEALAHDTHKFESRYLDNLIGPYPAAQAVYKARSPLNHLEGFRTPLIVFQGADDPIVPPNQAHMILGALRERQQPIAYMEFAGESHGFRRAENIIAAKEAELYFYGRVFKFTPADDLPEVRIENLPKP